MRERDALRAFERGEYRRYMVGRVNRKGGEWAGSTGCIDARSPEDAMAYADRVYPLRPGFQREFREVGPAREYGWFFPVEIGRRVRLPAQGDLFAAVGR